VVTPFQLTFRSLDGVLDTFHDYIEVWEGDGIPEWVCDVNGECYARAQLFSILILSCWPFLGKRLPQIRTLCTLTADLSGLRASLQALDGPKGKYYQFVFKVAIKFGGTQLQARIQWEEDVSAYNHQLLCTILNLLEGSNP